MHLKEGEARVEARRWSGACCGASAVVAWVTQAPTRGGRGVEKLNLHQSYVLAFGFKHIYKSLGGVEKVGETRESSR